MISDGCFWAFLIGFGCTAISLFSFSWLTMRRIEKQIKKYHLTDVKPLDFGGDRTVIYALAIVSPEHMALRLERFLDVRVVRNCANKADRIRGMLFLASFFLWVASILVCSLME